MSGPLHREYNVYDVESQGDPREFSMFQRKASLSLRGFNKKASLVAVGRPSDIQWLPRDWVY